MAHTEDIASRGWFTDFPGISLTGGQIADQMTAVPPLRGCHWVAKDSILLQMGCSLLRTGLGWGWVGGCVDRDGQGLQLQLTVRYMLDVQGVGGPKCRH